MPTVPSSGELASSNLRSTTFVWNRSPEGQRARTPTCPLGVKIDEGLFVAQGSDQTSFSSLTMIPRRFRPHPLPPGHPGALVADTATHLATLILGVILCTITPICVLMSPRPSSLPHRRKSWPFGKRSPSGSPRATAPETPGLPVRTSCLRPLHLPQQRWARCRSYPRT